MTMRQIRGTRHADRNSLHEVGPHVNRVHSYTTLERSRIAPSAIERLGLQPIGALVRTSLEMNGDDLDLKELEDDPSVDLIDKAPENATTNEVVDLSAKGQTVEDKATSSLVDAVRSVRHADRHQFVDRHRSGEHTKFENDGSLDVGELGRFEGFVGAHQNPFEVKQTAPRAKWHEVKEALRHLDAGRN